MIFNICNTAGWGKLDDKYQEALRPFSLKVAKSEEDYATIELNSLQDILHVVNQLREDVIIKKLSFSDRVTLEIYDDWRE